MKRMKRRQSRRVLDDTEPEEPKAYATVGQKEQDGKRDASIWKQIFRGESTVQELLAAVWEKIWKTTGTAAGRRRTNSRQAGGGNNRQTDRQKGRQNYGQSGSIQGQM